MIKYAADLARTYLDTDSKFLLALNAKANRTGSPIYAGVPAATRQKRRAAGKVARASRKANR